MACRAARVGRVAHRLLRCQHGSGGGPVGGGIHAGHWRRRLAGRAPRSRPVRARGRAGTHTAHCGWARRRGTRPQPSRPRIDWAARPGSPWCRAPPISSTNLERSRGWPTWLATGSSTTWLHSPIHDSDRSIASHRTFSSGVPSTWTRYGGVVGTCGRARTVRPDPDRYQSLICRILMYRSEMAGVRCAVTERGMR